MQPRGCGRVPHGALQPHVYHDLAVIAWVCEDESFCVMPQYLARAARRSGCKSDRNMQVEQTPSAQQSVLFLRPLYTASRRRIASQRILSQTIVISLHAQRRAPPSIAHPAQRSGLRNHRKVVACVSERGVTLAWRRSRLPPSMIGPSSTNEITLQGPGSRPVTGW